MKNSKVISHNDLVVYPANHPDIKAITKRQEEPSIHGDKVWDASFVLMDFLDQFPLAARSRVLEVGCGWGSLSCYLAQNYQGAITGLDADEAVKPYFDFHAQKNKVKPSFLQGTMKSITKKHLTQYDVILGGDICFWDSLKKEWQSLIRRAQKAGVKEIYISDPGRPPFWELVEFAEKQFGADIWSHDIKRPVAAEHYVLEIQL